MKNFYELLNQVNKIASLELESNESVVMSNMINNGIGASANDAIYKMSDALNTRENNKFTAKQEKEGYLVPQYSAEDFNRVNRDIEAILESGYNARVISQDMNLSDVFNGNPIQNDKGDMVLHLADNLGLKGKNKDAMSYSDFDAKYAALTGFINIAEVSNIRLAPANNLYLYNNVINLLNQIDSKNVHIDGANNMGELKTIKHGGLQHYLNGVSQKDFNKTFANVQAKRQILDEARKNLEKQLFNNAEDKFNMEDCHTKFAKAVENMQRKKKLLVDEDADGLAM